MLIPNTNMSLSGSKESYLYLIDNTKMGGATVDNSNVRQLLNVREPLYRVGKTPHLHYGLAARSLFAEAHQLVQLSQGQRAITPDRPQGDQRPSGGLQNMPILKGDEW